jgi:FkbM family methyltransferase
MKSEFKAVLRRFLPRSIHKHRILGGPLRGYRIVTSWHDYPAAITGRTERPLLAWLAINVKKGETWLDIGAHFGYTGIALSKLVGVAGRVFAFEPMISTAGCLAQTRELNKFPQLIVLPLGLANPESLELERLPATRGMVDSTLCPKKGGREEDEGQTVWQETIMLARLDWLWPRICGERQQIDGLKIDVQGMETEVLRGMRDLLKRHAPKLVIELHKGVNRDELLSLVTSQGYSLPPTPIEPIPGENEPLYLDDRSYAFRVQ